MFLKVGKKACGPQCFTKRLSPKVPLLRLCSPSFLSALTTSCRRRRATGPDVRPAVREHPERRRPGGAELARRRGRAADGARPDDADAAAVPDGRHHRRRPRHAQVFVLRRASPAPSQRSRSLELTPTGGPLVPQYFLHRCKVMDLIEPRPSQTITVKRPKNGWPSKKPIGASPTRSAPSCLCARLPADRRHRLRPPRQLASPHAPVRPSFCRSLPPSANQRELTLPPVHFLPGLQHPPLQPRGPVLGRPMRVPRQQGPLHRLLPLLGARVRPALPGLQVQHEARRPVPDGALPVLWRRQGVRPAPVRQLRRARCDSRPPSLRPSPGHRPAEADPRSSSAAFCPPPPRGRSRRRPLRQRRHPARADEARRRRAVGARARPLRRTRRNH